MIYETKPCGAQRMRFLRILQQRPCATADLHGSDEYPTIHGKLCLYETAYGVLVAVEVFGLPISAASCKKDIFAFHIHTGTACTGNQTDAFANALTHYNPCKCDHPNHAGDLPPLWGNSGYAFSVVLTDRFCVNEVLGKTVIIHRDPDDFTTQPAGNAGQKIACGIIQSTNSRRR